MGRPDFGLAHPMNDQSFFMRSDSADLNMRLFSWSILSRELPPLCQTSVGDGFGLQVEVEDAKM